MSKEKKEKPLFSLEEIKEAKMSADKIVHESLTELKTVGKDSRGRIISLLVSMADALDVLRTKYGVSISIRKLAQQEGVPYQSLRYKLALVGYTEEDEYKPNPDVIQDYIEGTRDERGRKYLKTVAGDKVQRTFEEIIQSHVEWFENRLSAEPKTEKAKTSQLKAISLIIEKIALVFKKDAEIKEKLISALNR